MNLDELTLGQLKQLQTLIPQSASKRLPMPIGLAVFIRTVTHHYTGRIVAVSEEEVGLKECAWIADDGRFAQAIEKGALGEVEPYPKDSVVVVNRGAIIDWVEWTSKLPASQK